MERFRTVMTFIESQPPASRGAEATEEAESEELVVAVAVVGRWLANLMNTKSHQTRKLSN